MTTLSFEPGAVIGERYRLESRLGEGGMGAVWRAQHTTLKSPVAVKFINPTIAGSESAISRFLLEAQSSAALRSTHIVQVFDFGIEQGVPYIAMELLQGETLSERLERDKRVPVEEVAHILFDVARAVAYAHEAGIVHRDLKPENIFLVDEKGMRLAKVLDFGVAKVTGGSLDLSTGGGTRTGAILGTPFYVSPEQGRGNQTIDHRSDLWALGIITYECVVGELPFFSQGLGDLIMKICAEPHPRASDKADLPAGFDRWMDRALAKDPEKRFQSALSMFESFSELVLGQSLGGSISSSRGSSGSRNLPRSFNHERAPRPTYGRATTTGATAAEMDRIPMRKSKATWALAATMVLAVTGAGLWAAQKPSSTSESPTPKASAPTRSPAHSLESPLAPAASAAPPSTSDSTLVTPRGGTTEDASVPAPAPRARSLSPRPAPAPQSEASTPRSQEAPTAPRAATSAPPSSSPKVTSTRLQEGDPAPAPRPASTTPLVPTPKTPTPAQKPEAQAEPKPKPSREQLARELMRSYD